MPQCLLWGASWVYTVQPVSKGQSWEGSPHTGLDKKKTNNSAYNCKYFLTHHFIHVWVSLSIHKKLESELFVTLIAKGLSLSKSSSFIQD